MTSAVARQASVPAAYADDEFSAPAEVYASDLPDPLALGALMAALGLLTLLSSTLLSLL